MKKDVKKSTRAAYALGTKKNLLIQWRACLLFYTYLNVLVFLSVCLRYVAIFALLHLSKRSWFPVSLSTICCYAEFLSRSLKYVDSIRNYINLDYPFPHLENVVYKLLIKGMVKTKKTFSKTCFTNHPRYFIGDGRVFRIIWFVRLGFFVNFFFFCLPFYVKKIYFSSWFRAFKKKCYAKKQLTRGKVFFNKGVAIVAFEWTKTIQSGELLNIPGSVLCPVHAYIRTCKVIPAPSWTIHPRLSFGNTPNYM